MKRTLILLCALAVTAVSAQKKKGKVYKFEDVKTVGVTSVKDQSRSGTCWSFSGLAFLESELLRAGKDTVDLSEMWVVRHTYLDKAVKYVRMHGKANFGGGGATHDVMNVIREHGIVPEEVYTGLQYGTAKHQHKELDAVLEAYMSAVLRSHNDPMTSTWQKGFNALLDTYLGPVPEKFTYKGVEYTPESFAASLGLNMDDYVSFTSFTHHPFYTQFAVEVPDNWAWGMSYNVPLEEFEALFDAAIDNGYSIFWAADVSEPGFKWNQGFAVVPDATVESLEGTEQARWVKMTPAQREAAVLNFDHIRKEKKITQQMRQEAYDSWETTDDHGMQIVGTAVDTLGNKYYKVKNSWGTTQLYGGYFYASAPYVAYKTMNLVVNKNAVPKELRRKLGIK